MQKGSRRGMKQEAVAQPIPNSSLWEQHKEMDHILETPHFCTTQAWKQLEAAGTTLPEQTGTDLMAGEKGNKTCFQVLHLVCLCFPCS